MKISQENRKFIRTLFVLAIPIVIQEIINSGVNFLDFLMVGQLGEDSINAVGLSNRLFFLFILLVFGVSSGSSVFMGQFWGMRDTKSIHKSMGICFLCAMAAAGIFAVIAIIFPRQVMILLSEKPEVWDLGVQYLRIVGFSYFISAITATFNASLRSIGQTKIPMFTSLIALVTNGLLNYVFIFLFHWGVAGAAVATLIARGFEVVAQIIIVFNLRLPVASPIRGYFSFSKDFVISFFKITLPVIGNEFTWSLGTFLYDVAYRFCGSSAQSAVQIGNNLLQMFMVLGMAVGSSCGIMLANQLGGGERDRAISYSRKCLLVGTSVSVVMAFLLFFISPFILNFYNISHYVRGLTINVMLVLSLALVVKIVNYTSIVGILRSGGDTKYCLLLDLLTVWIVGVPLAFLGATVLHLPIYIVVAMVVFGEEGVKAIFSLRRVFSNIWAAKIV